MNKAFIKESDEEQEPMAVPRSAQLPSSVKNYMTSDGAQRMRDELDRLEHVDVPAASQGNPSDAEAKRNLLRIEQRIQYLKECLRTAVPVDSSGQDNQTVRFGATVTVTDRAGGEFVYRIVGVDEIDLNRGWVSWLSPIAKALLNANVGSTISFRTPKGEEELAVRQISYT